MLKRLRIKFIALNMVIVALVLTVAFGVICALTYQQDMTSVRGLMDETLGRAVQARVLTYDSVSVFGAGGEPGLRGPGSADESDGESVLSPGDGLTPPEIGGRATSEPFTPLVTYMVDSSGLIVSLSTFSTALIPDAYLDQAVARALSESASFGSIDELGLLFSRQVEGPIAYLTFADISAIEGWKSLAATLALVGALVLAGFFVISVFFSRWALRPVEDAWGQQQRFVADASHELKTPLAVILANTAILREHEEETVASQQQWIESTNAEAKRMQSLVNDLLELAKIDGGQAAAVFTRIDLSDLVEGEVLQFESVAFERNVSLDMEVTPGVHVSGNAERAGRMVRTLIDNACKYAESGGSVRVRLTTDGRNAKLAVSNTGTAIDAADLPHIFERFYRADKSRARETGGFGLGLSIAAEIAREHKGSITATSNPERTTFTVALPLA